jgi:hypothetical protein
MGLQITDRDKLIMLEISRWRFLLSRQIPLLCGFEGQRACDRRIAKLIEAGYITRRHFLYGVPRLLFVNRKAVSVFGLPYYTPSVRIENIVHDSSVVDVANYLINHEGIDPKSITTERDLKNFAGFGNTAKHLPDFVYIQDGKKIAVEVELSEKKHSTIEKNMQCLFRDYDFQRWFVPSEKSKLTESVKTIGRKFNIEITSLERVVEYINGRK